MDFKQLREELKQFIETQVEGDDELQEVLTGTWTGEKGNTLADVVIPRIDELTIEQLTDIFNNSYELDGKVHSLFPSGFDVDKFGTYPAKLASALARSKESENLTDIYNVYYANRDEDAFKDAMVVWEDYIMSGQDNKLSNILQAIEDNESDADYDAQMFFELRRDHAHLVEFLINYLEDINPELADLTRQKFIKLQGE